MTSCSRLSGEPAEAPQGLDHEAWPAWSVGLSEHGLMCTRPAQLLPAGAGRRLPPCWACLLSKALPQRMKVCPFPHPDTHSNLSAPLTRHPCDRP